MERPKIKCELAILDYYKPCRSITFTATPDALSDVEGFGEVAHESIYHYMSVDPRYDFDEVMAYLQSYADTAA
jgi:hypothetical protein